MDDRAIQERLGTDLLPEPVITGPARLVSVSPRGLRDLARWVERKMLVKGEKGIGLDVVLFTASFQFEGKEVATFCLESPEDGTQEFARTQ